MILVGIDVSKDKHDCFITNPEGGAPAEAFVIPNTLEGFGTLLAKIRAHASPSDKIKVGLEATGHYSYNLLGFLLDNGLTTYVLNPLHTNLFRKGLSLRKTKTDRVDARTIAAMLLSDKTLEPYSSESYHNEELKSLSRYRFSLGQDRTRQKVSVSRLACILFPELEKLVSTLHCASIYALLEKFPGAKQVAAASLAQLANLLGKASRGAFGREKAMQIREAARKSIGAQMPAKSMELQHTIRRIRELDAEIKEVEASIQGIVEGMAPVALTVPGIGVQTYAMILAETGGFSCFPSPDKVLAYAGMSPSIHQSGKLKNCYPHMEKRGSRYLRYALYTAAKCVCMRDPVFAAYLSKKLAEGKHYTVAISHAAKKLVRLLYALEKSGKPYRCPA